MIVVRPVNDVHYSYGYVCVDTPCMVLSNIPYVLHQRRSIFWYYLPIRTQPIHIRVCVHTHTHMYIYIYIYICICMYMYTYMCMCICICMYAYTYA